MNKRSAAQLHQTRKKAIEATAACYVVGCKQKPIGSHSISKSRYLNTIAKDGHVFMISPSYGPELDMDPVGANKASVFLGFCQEHDGLFAPLDNDPYVPGSKEQEFLFAFRAAAREFSARNASLKLTEDVKGAILAGQLHGVRQNPDFEGFEDFQKQFKKGFEDMGNVRGRLNKYLVDGRYNRLYTYVITAEPAVPIVASSSFHIELDPAGNVVTDVMSENGTLRPCFYTVFPQGEETYALITIDMRDRERYSWLEQAGNLSNEEKQLLISNLLINHVENFALNPDHWDEMGEEKHKTIFKHFGDSLTSGGLLNSLGSPNINLFV